MKMMWIIYALIGMVCLGVMTLIFKKLLEMGLKPELVLDFIFGFGMLFYLLQVVVTKTMLNINWNIIFLLALAAFLSYVGNLFTLKSLALTPNPGYTQAIVSLNIAFITLASILLFGSKITLIKGAGVVCAIIGLILLAL